MLLFFVGNTAIAGISAELFTYVLVIIAMSFFGLCFGTIIRRQFIK